MTSAHLLRVVALLGCAAFPALAHEATRPLTGHWVGVAHLGRRWVEMTADFTRDSAGTAGRYAVPMLSIEDQIAAEQTVSDSLVTLRIPGTRDTARFRGTLRADAITGVATWRADTGAFRLDRYVRLPPAVLARSQGDYRLSDGRIVTLTVRQDGMHYVDLRTSRRHEIALRSIGAWGHSQGGWIAPLATVRAKNLSFVVIVSGPTVNPAIQTRYYTEHAMRAVGYDEAPIADAVAYMNRVVDVASRRAGWDELALLVARAKTQRWEQFVTTPDSLADLLSWPSFDYEPIPLLRTVAVPILAIFGERDPLVPGVESAVTLRNLSARSGKDVTVFLIPDANHDIAAALTGFDSYDGPWQHGYAPGYFEGAIRWINTRVGRAR